MENSFIFVSVFENEWQQIYEHTHTHNKLKLELQQQQTNKN